MPRTAWFSELESRRDTTMPTTCWLWLHGPRRFARDETVLGDHRFDPGLVWALTLGS